MRKFEKGDWRFIATPGWEAEKEIGKRQKKGGRRRKKEQ